MKRVISPRSGQLLLQANCEYNPTMTRVEFASSIVRHAPVEPMELPGATVAELLGQVFGMHPKLRGYVLDDQGSVRKHVTVFINDKTISDRAALSDTVAPDDCIYVFQALSGGS